MAACDIGIALTVEAATHANRHDPRRMVVDGLRTKRQTILLSVISMLSSPNDDSPANIDAAVGPGPPSPAASTGGGGVGCSG